MNAIASPLAQGVVGLLVLGLFAWCLALLDVGAAFAFRPSSVRAVFLIMGLGWPVAFLRELTWMRRDQVGPFLVLGVCGGLTSSFILVKRWLANPGVLR